MTEYSDMSTPADRLTLVDVDAPTIRMRTFSSRKMWALIAAALCVLLVVISTVLVLLSSSSAPAAPNALVPPPVAPVAVVPTTTVDPTTTTTATSTRRSSTPATTRTTRPPSTDNSLLAQQRQHCHYTYKDKVWWNSDNHVGWGHDISQFDIVCHMSSDILEAIPDPGQGTTSQPGPDDGPAFCNHQKCPGPRSQDSKNGANPYRCHYVGYDRCQVGPDPDPSQPMTLGQQWEAYYWYDIVRYKNSAGVRDAEPYMVSS